MVLSPVRAEGHLVLYNPDTFTEYDFWQATTVRDEVGNSLGGGRPGTAILEAGTIDFFDVRGSGVNPATYFSASASGVPLLAGLILPEDVERGVIEHALAVAIPGPRNTNVDNPYKPHPSDYFYPASTTETDFFNTNPLALAMGQRIRLKQTIVNDEGNPIDENQLAPITRRFLGALRTYGAYLVDGAGSFAFSAEDIHTAVLHLSNEEVNTLIGQPPGTPLPEGKTKWQIVIEKLNVELEHIPVAYGPLFYEWKDPRTATIDIYNFEVVESITPPPGWGELEGRFKVTDLRISPSEAEVEQTITISVNVTNVGWQSWGGNTAHECAPKTGTMQNPRGCQRHVGLEVHQGLRVVDSEEWYLERGTINGERVVEKWMSAMREMESFASSLSWFRRRL